MNHAKRTFFTSRPRRIRLRSAGAAVLACTATAVAGGGALAAGLTSGEASPALHLTGNGHLLHPLGRLVKAGNFPDGSAVLPGGRFVWVLDCGHGKNDVMVLDVQASKVVQTLPLPGCYGGIAFSPDGRRAYVSGTPKGGSPTEGATQGDQGDVVHIFEVDPQSGRGTERAPLQLAAVSGGSGQNDSLPPSSGTGSEQPEGLAVSPDGQFLVVALNAADAAVVVNLRTLSQSTVAVGSYPDGVVFDPRGRAYISNEYAGTISVIDPAAAKVVATISGLGGPLGDLASHPEGMAADPRRPALYVAVTDRDLIAVIDTSTESVSRLVSVGRPEGIGTEPTHVAVSPDGSTLFASDAGEDSLSVVSLTRRPRAARLPAHRVYLPPRLGQIAAYRAAAAPLMRRLAHTRGSRAGVRLRIRGALEALSVRYLSPRVQAACGGPTRAQERLYLRRALHALATTRRQRALLAAAQRGLPETRSCRPGWLPGLPAYRLVGRIPTGAYPDDVQTTPTGRLVWIAGKGFGSGPNLGYTFDGARTPYQTPKNSYGTYVMDMLTGRLGVLPIPTDRQVVAATPVADAQSRPSNGEPAPPGSPIPAQNAHPSAQIKHVFYIVRENRTYDQIFGSDPRGDGNPRLELFDDNGVSGPTGGVTPNAHALARQFPLLDHFNEDSEVSVDGHIITAGAESNDYVQKATAANYSGRRGTYDFGIYPVTFPPKFFLFDQAAAQNVSFRDYGEAVGTAPMGDAPNRPEFSKVEAGVDTGYPNNLFIGCLHAGVRASCTQDSGLLNGTGSLFAPQSRFDEWYPQFEQQVASGTVPTLSYMILPNDHTDGTTTGDLTPQAMIADNDLALGQIVDAISHSSIWPSTAIFVVEDDSQDGADHVDSHRSPAFVISPWARHGAVVHTRYDQYSVLRTIELITGIDPLALNDAVATPMYDAFLSGGAKPDDSPYTARVPSYSISQTNQAAAADGALSDELPWNRIDAVPQAISDRILWASVHGAASAPPPPGPDASPGEQARAAAVSALLRRHPSARRPAGRSSR